MRLLLKSLTASGCLVAFAASLCLADTGNPDLIQAVRSKDAGLVRQLIEHDADVNAPQGGGATALHWAAHLDDLAIADLLVRSNADVNTANDMGATPLQLACTNRSSRMVELLLGAGADANARLLNGETVLMTCARTGDPESVRALLAHGARVNEREVGHQQTALMWAVAQSHPEVVRLLLQAGADLQARSLIYPQRVLGESKQRPKGQDLSFIVSRGGSTALLFAARVGDAESARLLLQAGADPNDCLPDGTSALVLAAHSGHGDAGMVLLEKGADPDAAATGYTALHAAVLTSQFELTQALLAKGANPNVRMTNGTPIRRNTTDFNLPGTLAGSTPYFLAAKFVEARIMRALVAGGADPKLTMPDGTTPLMAAAGVGSSFTKNRRDISVIDVGGQPEPESQILEAVAAAVELGADLNAVNAQGDSALHGAAVHRYDKVIQLLTARGADINLKNKRGLTPLATLLRRKAARSGSVAAGESTGATGTDTVALMRNLGAE